MGALGGFEAILLGLPLGGVPGRGEKSGPGIGDPRGWFLDGSLTVENDIMTMTVKLTMTMTMTIVMTMEMTVVAARKHLGS